MLPFTQQSFLEMNFERDTRQHEWVVNDLTRIPASEGFRVHTQLRGVRMLDQWGNEAVPVFYRCRHYDDETNRCTSYDSRPDTCRDFPFGYGSTREMREAMALPPSCSFNADLGREVQVRIR